MKTQNFKNHTQTVFGFHGVLFFLYVVFAAGAFNYWARSSADNFYLASLLLFLLPILLLVFWYLRVFALKAQDRAIRAEERLRYFIMTKKICPAI
jgi:apolipoprotein N-acyltransferase